MDDSEGCHNKRSIVRFSCEKLELRCEWDECDFVEIGMQEYMKHIEIHLSSLSSDSLVCRWKDCEAFTETLPDLHRHILFHAFHTKIKCYGKNLQERKNLSECLLDSSSRNIIPELPDPLICCWVDCTEVFENPEVFYRHVESHIDYTVKKKDLEMTVKCLWQGCNKTCADHYKVKDHLKSHTQEKLVACPTCGGMFASRTKFFDHIQRQTSSTEDKQKTYTCEFCSRKLTTERLLRDHARHHVNHYKCPYCDMTCPTPSGLQAHVRYRHSSCKPFSCQYCEYKGKRLADLRKHLETHSSIKNFQCPFEKCGYATKTSNCYRIHLSKKHKMDKAPVYACHLCQNTFCRGHYLSKHLINRHKFRWPSGHCRFRYHQDEDGMFRLQTVRYEIAELSEAMLCDDTHQEAVLCDNENSVDSPDVAMQCSEVGTTTNNTRLNSSEQQISDTEVSNAVITEASTAQSLSRIPVYYCVQSETSSIQSQVVAEGSMFCESSDPTQPVIVQYVNSPPLVVLNIPDIENQGDNQSPEILV